MEGFGTDIQHAGTALEHSAGCHKEHCHPCPYCHSCHCSQSIHSNKR